MPKVRLNAQNLTGKKFYNFLTSKKEFFLNYPISRGKIKFRVPSFRSQGLGPKWRSFSLTPKRKYISLIVFSK